MTVFFIFLGLMAGFYALLLLLLLYKLGRAHVLRHKLWSYANAFLSLSATWCFMRVVWWSTYILLERESLLDQTLYWLPINFQFAAFSVLVLFYAEDVRKRKGELYEQRRLSRTTAHRIYYGVNLLFSVVSIALIVLWSSVDHFFLQQFHSAFVGILFLILSFVLAVYGFKYSRVASPQQSFLVAQLTSPRGSGEQHSMDHELLASTFMVFLIFIIRCIYNFFSCASEGSSSVHHLLQIGPTVQLVPALVTGVLLIMWEMVPTALVVWTIGRRPATHLHGGVRTDALGALGAGYVGFPRPGPLPAVSPSVTGLGDPGGGGGGVGGGGGGGGSLGGAGAAGATTVGAGGMLSSTLLTQGAGGQFTIGGHRRSSGGSGSAGGGVTVIDHSSFQGNGGSGYFQQGGGNGSYKQDGAGGNMYQGGGGPGSVGSLGGGEGGGGPGGERHIPGSRVSLQDSMSPSSSFGSSSYGPAAAAAAARDGNNLMMPGPLGGPSPYGTLSRIGSAGAGPGYSGLRGYNVGGGGHEPMGPMGAMAPDYGARMQRSRLSGGGDLLGGGVVVTPNMVARPPPLAKPPPLLNQQESNPFGGGGHRNSLGRRASNN